MFNASDKNKENQYFESLNTSPYFKAVLSNDEHTLKKLFSEPNPAIRLQNANLTSPTGDSLLMVAVYKGNLEMTKFLLEHGANVQARNEQGYTALHLAMPWMKIEIADLLLEHKADLCAKTKKGEIPLSLLGSKLYKNDKSLEFIKKHLQKIPKTEYDSLLKTFTHGYHYFYRKTVFQEIVQYLLENGAQGFENKKSLLFAIVNPQYCCDKQLVEQDIVLLKKLCDKWPHLLIGEGQSCLLELIFDCSMSDSIRKLSYDYLKSCYGALIENSKVTIPEPLIQSYYACLEAEEALKSKEKIKMLANEKIAFSHLAKVAANDPNITQYEHFLSKKYNAAFIAAFQKNRTVTALCVNDNPELLCGILPVNQTLQALSLYFNNSDDFQHQGLIDALIKKLHECPKLNTLKIEGATDDIMCKLLEVPHLHSIDLICEGGGGCLDYTSNLKDKLKNAQYLSSLRLDVGGIRLLPICLETLAQNSSLRQLHIDSFDEGGGALIGPPDIMNPVTLHLCKLILKQQLHELVLTYGVNFHEENNDIKDGNEEHAWLFKLSIFKALCQTLLSCKSIVKLGFSTNTLLKAHFESLLNLLNHNPYVIDIDWYPSDIDHTRNSYSDYTTIDTQKFATQCKPEFREIVLQIQEHLERNKALKGLIAWVTKAANDSSSQSKLESLQGAVAEASSLYKRGQKSSMEFLKQLCDDFGLSKLLHDQNLMPVQRPLTVCFKIVEKQALIKKEKTEMKSLFEELENCNSANHELSGGSNSNNQPQSQASNSTVSTGNVSQKRKREDSQPEVSHTATNNQSSSSEEPGFPKSKKAKN